MLIIRYSAWGETHHATLAERELRVMFESNYRTKKVRDSPIGRIREIEATTKRTDAVRLIIREARQGDGGKIPSSVSVHPMRLLDHRKMVRVLTADDLAELRGYDITIEKLNEELASVRRMRANHVKAAWRRAQPFGLDEIEQRAKDAAKPTQGGEA